MASDAEILAELKKLNKNAQKTEGPVFGTVSVDDLMKNAFGLAGKAANDLGAGFEKVKSVIEPNLDAFRELSKSGNNFQNDIVQMAVAVKRTGLDLKDFTDVISKNGMNMAGLGGSVSEGSRRFVELSESLRKSDMAEYMRQAGMTNKDLNEVMAVQIGFMRTSMKDNKNRDAELVESTGKLAGEMDLMAKLTGKTREEQADAMKKAQADMQVEAKMRMIGIKEGPEAEAKARAAFAEQYNQAQLRGQGQMFKEVFATGQVTSQEARMQSALLGKEAQATSDQARATAKGNVEEARRFNQIAQEEAIKNNKNLSLMTVASYGDAGGAASKSMMDTMKSQQTFRDSMESIRKEAEFRDKSEADIMKEANRRVIESQAGRDKDGAPVSGATKAVIALGARVDDVNAALYKGLVTPLNERIGPQLDTFATRYLGPRTRTGKQYQEAIENTVKDEADGTRPQTREDLARKPAQEYVGQGLVSDAAKAVRETGKLIETGLETINQLKEGGGANPNARRGASTQSVAPDTNTRQNTAVQSDTANSAPRNRAELASQPKIRDSGTLGMTGNVFEQEDFYGKVAKGETVMTPGQLENLIKGTSSGAATGSAASLMNQMKQQSGLANKMESSGTSNIQEMRSIMDQQTKASDLSSKMESLGLSKTQEMFKMMGTTQSTAAEAKAQAAMATAARTAASPEEGKTKPIETREASLNDVVSKLDKLNINISKLNESLLDIGSKQIKAVKANSKNLYERA
jgi:hypothetical protein